MEVEPTQTGALSKRRQQHSGRWETGLVKSRQGDAERRRQAGQFNCAQAKEPKTKRVRSCTARWAGQRSTILMAMGMGDSEPG